MTVRKILTLKTFDYRYEYSLKILEFKVNSNDLKGINFNKLNNYNYTFKIYTKLKSENKILSEEFK